MAEPDLEFIRQQHQTIITDLRSLREDMAVMRDDLRAMRDDLHVMRDDVGALAIAVVQLQHRRDAADQDLRGLIERVRRLDESTPPPVR